MSESVRTYTTPVENTVIEVDLDSPFEYCANRDLARLESLERRKSIINDAIRHACHLGKFSTVVFFHLLDHEAKMLKDAGYKAESSTVGETYTSISWGFDK